MSSDTTSSSDSFNTISFWLESHPVSFTPEKWQDQQFREFISMTPYPHFAKGEKLLSIIGPRLPEKEQYQKSIFKSWQNALRPEQLEEHDRYEFEILFMHIFCSWVSFFTQMGGKGFIDLMNPQIQRQETIRPSRKGLDSLIEVAFQLRSGAEHMWLQALDLALPGYPDAVHAEGVTTMSLPILCQAMISRQRLDFNFSWSYSNKPQSVVTFVYVAADGYSNSAKKEALRRLQMCFYSCHMHRRALCCSDGQVFGGLVFGSSMRLYVSFWNGDVLEVRPILESFAPILLDSFVECYFTLCRISEHQAEYFQKEFKRWGDQSLRRLLDIEESAKNIWRKENRWEIESTDDSCNENVWEDSAISGASAPLSEAAVDPRVMYAMERVRRGHPPQNGFSLTRTHKRAFDILTQAEKSEEFHSIQSPSTWAEETYKYRGEYEDPTPCSYDETEDSSVDGRDHVESGVEITPFSEDNSEEYFSLDGSDDVDSAEEVTDGPISPNDDPLMSDGEREITKHTSCASEGSIIAQDTRRPCNETIAQDVTSSIRISISKRGAAGNKCSWDSPLISVVPCRRARSET